MLQDKQCENLWFYLKIIINYCQLILQKQYWLLEMEHLVFLKQAEAGHFLGKEQVTVMINFQMENLYCKGLKK